jgi:hypothetical protein
MMLGGKVGQVKTKKPKLRGYAALNSLVLPTPLTSLSLIGESTSE